MTGPQRYLREVLPRLRLPVARLAPGTWNGGIRGHVWEQVALPRLLGDRLLWSPSTTGPLSVRSQVLTIHDVSFVDHPEWHGRRFGAWYRWLVPRLARRVRRVLTGSRHSAERIAAMAGVPPGRIVVTPYGVDPRFGPRPSGEVDRARHVLGIPDGPYVLCLGSLEPRKNLARLLRAWGVAGTTIPGDMWLVVAGDRPPRPVFRRLALRDLPPRVHFAGRVADDVLPALYAGAVAFAYPSLYEGFGLPVLEAMATGVPVLVGDRGGLPELVGGGGVVVDPASVGSIADGLHRLASDPALGAELGGEGISRAARFTWERTALLTMEVLREAGS